MVCSEWVTEAQRSLARYRHLMVSPDQIRTVGVHSSELWGCRGAPDDWMSIWKLRAVWRTLGAVSCRGHSTRLPSFRSISFTSCCVCCVYCFTRCLIFTRSLSDRHKQKWKTMLNGFFFRSFEPYKNICGTILSKLHEIRHIFPDLIRRKWCFCTRPYKFGSWAQDEPCRSILASLSSIIMSVPPCHSC